MRFGMRFLKSFLIVVSAIGVASCGDDAKDDSGDEVEEGAVGSATTTNMTGTTHELSFPGTEAGSQYALMPFTLGPDGSAGGDLTQLALNVKFSAGAAAAGGDSFQMHKPQQDRLGLMGDSNMGVMSASAYEDGTHQLFHSFDPSKGFEQKSGFWRLAQKLDQTSIITMSHEGVHEEAYVESDFVNIYENKIKNPRKVKALALAEGCVDGLVPWTNGQDDYDLAEMSPEAGEGFCVYYEKDPVSAGTKEEIKTAIAAMWKIFQDTIYGEAFDKTSGTYKFFPHILIVEACHTAGQGDCTEAQWLGDSFLGGYDSRLARTGDSNATDYTAPFIYMPVDMKLLETFKAVSDDNVIKRNWYSTLAHEFQHALLDYYRITGGGVQEVANVDEGLAHYVEDMFGGGDLIFGGKVQTFLTNFGVGGTTFFPTGEDNDALRGAMQSVMFYAASRLGSVDFTDGVVSGGDGVGLVKKIAVDAKAVTGTASIAAATGIADLRQFFGDYISALILDGRFGDDVVIDAKHKTMGSTSGVKDLTGNADGVFGFTYNNFDPLKETTANSDAMTAVDEDGLDLALFQATPVIYTVTDPDAKVTLTMEEAVANSAVTVVRIK